MIEDYTFFNAAYDAATELENIDIELELLGSLFDLYIEHRENELQCLKPEEPHSIPVFIQRQRMEEALLLDMRENMNKIQEYARRMSAAAYDAALGNKATGSGAVSTAAVPDQEAATAEAKPTSVSGVWLLERDPNGNPHRIKCAACDAAFSCKGFNAAPFRCPNCGEYKHGSGGSGNKI